MSTRIFHQSKVSHYTIDLTQGKGKKTVPLVSLLEVKSRFQKRNRKAGEEYFSRYNIFAYSFPEDALNINVIFNLIGEIFLYLTDIAKAKDRDLPETAFCLIFDKTPEAILKQLEEAEITIEGNGNGIYYAKFPFLFKIVALTELQKEKSAEVKALIEYLELKHK